MITQAKTAITVVDDIMGSGKTSWAIQFMNDEPKDKKFIFITPFEKETERIKAKVISREMILPDKIVGHGRKLNHLKKLLTNGDNIATTHALFKHFDNEVLLLLKLSNYILIMDETAELFKLESTKKADINLLLGNNSIEVDNDGKVFWLDESYDGKFIHLKLMCEREKLYMTKDKAFVWTFPVEIIKQFTEVYVLTYMFEAQIQKAFFHKNQLAYTKMSVCKNENEYSLTTFSIPSAKPFKHLITIYEGNNNDIGRPSSKEHMPHSNLSFGKLEKVRADSKFCEAVRKHIESFIRINCPNGSKFFMWTAPKKTMKKFEGKAFKRGKGFVASNSRATNEHAHKNACAYVLNKFMHPSMKMFINTNGITVNEDEYAVSEFVQWLFRSAIRNSEPITVYIPSERMRTLFKQWLNDEPIGL